MVEESNLEYSRAPELEDLISVCRSLNDHGVKYLLIGGFAVILQGLARFTKDIDLLIDPSEENVRKLKMALSYLPDNAISLIQESEVKKYPTIRIADEIVIDLLTSPCGITYEEARKSQELIPVENISIPIPSKETLIRMKHTMRPQDQSDVEYLIQRIKEDKKNSG